MEVFKRNLPQGSDSGDPKRPKSDGVVVVLKHVSDYGNVFDEIVEAMEVIDSTFNFNMGKLNIVNEIQTFEKWTVKQWDAGQSNWRCEAVLDLGTVGICSMIPGFGGCDTLKIVASKSIISAYLFIRIEELHMITYLTYQEDLNQDKEVSKSFLNFFIGLGFIPSKRSTVTQHDTCIVEYKPPVRMVSGDSVDDAQEVQDEEISRIGIDSVDAIENPELYVTFTSTYLDIAKWKAYVYSDDFTKTRYYYELKTELLDPPSANKLFIQFFHESDKFLAVIHEISDHKLLRFKGLGDDDICGWGYIKDIHHLIEQVESELVTYFYPDLNTQIAGPQLAFGSRYTDIVSKIDNITSRIVRLIGNH